ncbi:hypothetical protein JRO89_XS08G0018600 [Xanthoceras sorbifolium]|uniref:Uncharacterized protein n=1 Tax=Xanthoceras sorbifolium TaxID=99658 RepID=A0ABQ8HN67_9ROSI|nr:hypothetical protein JRO89_XS08G0018600 [Xanthoceras sorbifolium]
MLAAVAAAQNLALFGQQQHPQAVMNPAVYGGLFAAANPGLINPVVAGALNQGVVPTGHVGAMGGLGGANSSMLGPYGAGQPPVYHNASVRNQGTPGSFPGYTSYMCFGFWCLCNVCWFNALYSKILTWSIGNAIVPP